MERLNRNKIVWDYLRPIWDKPFVFGEHDCFTLACGAIFLLENRDLSVPFAGKYKTAIGALRVAKKAGYSSYKQFFSENGLPKIGAGDALVGDIALLEDEDGQFASIVLGPQAATVCDIGISVLPLELSTPCFAVGRR